MKAKRAVSSGVLVTILLGTITFRAAALEVRFAAYVPDRTFPQFTKFFHEGWGVTDDLGQPRQYTGAANRGAVLRVIVRNETSRPVEVRRLLLNGVDLSEQLAPRHREHGGIRAASFHLNDAEITPPDLRRRLEAMGGPIWWQVRPNPIAAGAFAESTVRLRRLPEVKQLRLTVETAADSARTAALSMGAPARLQLALVSFNTALDRMYLLVRTGDGSDFSVQRVTLDGVTVSPAAPAGVPAAEKGVLPLELALPRPFRAGSFHCVRVETAEAGAAAEVVHVRRPFFSLGMWGYRNEGYTLEDMVADCCRTFERFLFNTHMGMAAQHSGFLRSPQGLELLRGFGLRCMARAPKPKTVRSPQLYARFLLDEPDCRDYAVKNLPYNLRIGAYAQALVERQNQWTRADPVTPTLLNVDMTFKPENWRVYGRLPDIFALDPYYQNRLRDTYFSHPRLLLEFAQPTVVLGVCEVARFASEPRPLHVILNCTSYRKGKQRFRFGTPEEKAIEFHYALACGAKGISYWWFTPYGTYTGCGVLEPAALAMLKEMAHLNAEARALAPLLGRAAPAAAPGLPDPFVRARPEWLFARTLLAGADAALVVLVNRDHLCDRVGTVVKPIPKAQVRVALPAWLKRPAGALRLTPRRLTDLKPASTTDGEAVFELTDVRLTEVLLISRRQEALEDVRNRWQGFAKRLAAIDKISFAAYQADRKQAAAARKERELTERQALFDRYAKLSAWRVAASEAFGAYGVTAPELWDPVGEKYNARAWWVARGKHSRDDVKGLRWKAPRSGPAVVAINYVPHNRYRLRLRDGHGQLVREEVLSDRYPARSTVTQWKVDLPEGAAIEFIELGRDAAGGEMWGRVSPHAYFLPVP